MKPNFNHKPALSRVGRTPTLKLPVGSLILYRNPRNSIRKTVPMDFGVVLERRSWAIPGGQRHPFKFAAMRTGKRETQYFLKVENMHGDLEILSPKYVHQIIPPDVFTVTMTRDDVKEVLQALPKEHPTHYSIVAQVATYPVVRDSLEETITKARQLLAYMQEVKITPSKKVGKNYYYEENDHDVT